MMPTRRGKVFFFLMAIVLFSLSGVQGEELYAYKVKKKPEKLIESFDDYDDGSFPRRFRTYPFQRDQAEKVYRVAEEAGNRFLRAHDDQDISVQVMRQFYWDVERYPWARWRWRARILPAGGDERVAESNDSACGVYIVFGKYTGKALKYVWSTGAPVGTVVKKKPDKFYILPIVSGSASSGQWREVVINVADEFHKHFGEGRVRNPTGFGILTDGNALHVPASCDYDDFAIYSYDPRR